MTRSSLSVKALARKIGRVLPALIPISMFWFGQSSATAMEVTVIGNTIILAGPVTGDELVKVRDAFAKTPTIDVAVLRNSWGGDAWTGYRVGELFRSKGITTAVSGHCFSSCSRMFLGGRQRIFTDDYAASSTFIGFHGHYDASGRLNSQYVSQMGLYRWIIKHSDGKADEALVKRWINIERGLGGVFFLHPDEAATRDSSVYICTGSESNRPLGCESLATNALERGVITDLRRITSPDR